MNFRSTSLVAARSTGLFAWLLYIGSFIGGARELAAADELDVRKTRDLVALVAAPSRSSLPQALSLHSTMADTSAAKLVANQALALLELHGGKYSEAWSHLHANLQLLESAHSSVRLRHEKIKLWLLLEARSAQPAEAQFKRLVGIAVSPSLSNGDRDDVCFFLGGLIRMLQAEAEAEASLIPQPLVARSWELLESSGNKLSQEKLRTGWKLAESHSVELAQRLEELSKDANIANRTIDAIKSEIETTTQAIADLNGEMEQLRAARSEIESNRSAISKNQLALKKEMNRETPGKPQTPTPPRFPSLPKGKKNSNTGREELTASEERETREKMRVYRFAQEQYDRALDEYPARMNAWQQIDAARRADLLQQKLQVDKAMAAKNAESERNKEAVAAASGKIRQATTKSKEFERSIQIVTIAQECLEKNHRDLPSAARPSNYFLFDFPAETARLHQGLRVSK